MKNLPAILLLSLLPSCKAIGAAFSGEGEGPPPEAEAAGSTAALVATGLTGNPAVGAVAGALVTAGAMLFYGKRKKKPAA